MSSDQVQSFSTSTFLLILLSFFCPPFGILALRGCDSQLCINILLTVCGYLPGLVHAIYLITRPPKLSNDPNGSTPA
ncbi:3000_t:CDS:2 [Acaulospora morrowiae]|uniref:3000_t:CDS:1 n=1 Tax=Acaulospora morrowiae TaxID=94023 RepID=A0A9N8V866_9GLOM|nr:3000_t:CDS:2 [Acaulospora morrowiae]